MAEGRVASAWLNACKMSGCHYMFVEGVSDECFWKKFISRDAILIQQVNGWENVVECVREFNEEALSSKCIGIIDSDFENLFPYKSICENNIFLTDDHDIEMMMYHSVAFESSILAIDKKNKLKNSSNDILASVLQITDRIGNLKMYSMRNGAGLLFKRISKKTHEIELPQYESLIDSKGNYLGNKQLISYIKTFSRNNSNNPKSISVLNEHKIETEIELLQNQKLDSFQLSNGHDITYLLPYILRRKYGLILNDVNEGTIMIALLSAYNEGLLMKTKLYQAMKEWADFNKTNIFKF